MKLYEVLKQYHAGFRHNPSHFYPNSFRVETEGRRLVLIAVVKRHVRKNYRVVAILKRR